MTSRVLSAPNAATMSGGRLRNRMRAAAAVIVFAVSSLFALQLLDAQASTTVELLATGGAASDPTAVPIDLSSFAAADAQTTNAVLSLTWPEAVGLNRTALTNITSVQSDSGDQALTFVGRTMFKGQNRDAALVIDWPVGGIGTPTISIGLQTGQLDLETIDPDLQLPGSQALTLGTPQDPSFVVFSTGFQDTGSIDGASSFYPSSVQPTKGLFAHGSSPLGVLAPGVGSGKLGQLNGEIGLTAEGITFLNADEASENLDVDKVSLAVTVAQAGLALPSGTQSSDWEIGVSYDTEADELAAFATATVTLSNQLLGNDLQLAMSLEYNGTTPRVVGSIVGGTWTDALGTGIDVEAFTITFTGDANAPALEVSGTISNAVGSGTLTVGVVGDDFSATLELEELSVNTIVGLLEKRFGGDAVDVPAEFSDLRLAATITFESSPGMVSASAVGTATLDGTSASMLIALWDDEGSQSGIVAGAIDSFSLGDLLGDGLPASMAEFMLPAVAIRANDTDVDTEEMSSAAQTFLQTNFCEDAATACVLESGVAARGTFPIPASLKQPLEALWIDTTQPLVIEGSADVFSGSGTNFAMSMVLPPIQPPNPEDAPWLESAQLSLDLAYDGDFSFAIVGDMTVLIPDEDAPGGNDIVSFQVSAALSTDLASGTASLTLSGGLDGPWITPMGVDWLTFTNLQLQLEITVGTTNGVTVGIRGGAILGTGPTAKDLDVSFAIGVSTPPLRIDAGLRIASRAGITLDDIILIAEGAGMPALTQAEMDSLPDIAVRNIELSLSTIDAPDLCLSRGITIAGDLYVGENLTPAPPNAEDLAGTCGVEAPVDDTDPNACVNQEDCYGSVRFEVSDDGIFVDASLSAIDLGPLEITGSGDNPGPRLRLVVSPEQQLFEVSGGIKITGFAEANGSVSISSAGFAFSLYVGDEAMENFFQIDGSALMSDDVDAIVFNLDVRLVLDVSDVVDPVWNDTLAPLVGGPQIEFNCLRLAVTDFTVSSSFDLSGEALVGIYLLVDGAPEKFEVTWDFGDTVVANVEGILTNPGFEPDPEGGCGIPPKIDFNPLANSALTSDFVLRELGGGYEPAQLIRTGAAVNDTMAVLPEIFFTDNKDYELTVDWGDGTVDTRAVSGSRGSSEVFVFSNTPTLDPGVATETRTVRISMSLVGENKPPVHSSAQAVIINRTEPYGVTVNPPTDQVDRDLPPEEGSFMRIDGISFSAVQDAGLHEVTIDWGDGTTSAHGNYTVDPANPLAPVDVPPIAHVYARSLPNGQSYPITVSVRSLAYDTTATATTSALVGNVVPNFGTTDFFASGAPTVPLPQIGSTITVPQGQDLRYRANVSDGAPVTDLQVGASVDLGDLTLLPVTDLGSGIGQVDSIISLAGRVAGEVVPITFSLSDDAGTGETFTISVVVAAPNVTQATATPISGISVSAQSNTWGSPIEPGEPNQAPDRSGAVWWEWTPSLSGLYVLDDIGSTTVNGANQATIISVYDTNLGLLATADDVNGTTTALVGGTAGTTYLVGVQATGNVADPSNDPNTSGPVVLNVALAEVPVNDLLADAITLAEEGGPFPTWSANGSTIAASSEADEPTHAGRPTADFSVWYSWTPGVTAPFDVSVSATDPVVAIYRREPGTVGFDLIEVASNDDDPAGGTFNSKATVDAVAGTEYLIAVSAFNEAAQSDFTLAIDPIAVTNDLSTNPTPIVDAASSSNVGAVLDTDEWDSVAGTNGTPSFHAVWFEWTVPFDNDRFSVSVDAAFDSRVFIYPTGSFGFPCGSGGECFNGQEFSGTAGRTYLIAIDGESAADIGGFDVTIDSVNEFDDFDAWRLLVEEIDCGCEINPITMRNTGTTVQPNEPAHWFVPASQSAWVAWDVPASGRYEISTVSSAADPVDTVLAVYAADINDPQDISKLTLVDHNDDADETTTNSSVVVDIEIDPNQFRQYHLAVDGYRGDVGQFEMFIRRIDGGDDFADAIDISGQGPFDLPVLDEASAEAGESAHIGRSGLPSYWFRWTPPSNDTWSIFLREPTTQPIVDPDLVFAAYRINGFGELVPIGGGQVGDGLTTNSQATVTSTGEPIYIAIAGSRSEPADFSFIPASAPAPNDVIGAPALLEGISDSAVLDNTSGTFEIGEPNPSCVTMTTSVWARWQAPSSMRVTFNTAGSDFDTQAAVYIAGPTGLVEVGCNDDAVPGVDLSSSVSFVPEAGAFYYVQLDGFQTQTGTVQLGIEQSPPLAFHPFDTVCTGLEQGTIRGGDGVTFSVASAPCSVPASATAVSANLIVRNPVAAGNLRLGAAGTVLNGGVLNFTGSGLENSNSLMVPVSASGELLLEVNGGPQGAGQVLADGVTIEIVGWFGTAQTVASPRDYIPITPCTVFDSRFATASRFAGPFTEDEELNVAVTGSLSDQGTTNSSCGVPSGTSHVLVNSVLLNSVGDVTLTNFTNGMTMANNATLSAAMNNSSAVIVPLTPGDGQLEVDLLVPPGSSTNLRFVVLGYYQPVLEPGGLTFSPLTPCATFDTRSGADGLLGPRNGGQSTTYDVRGTFPSAQGGGQSDCGVPVDAVAVEINLVALNAIRDGNLRVSPSGESATGGVLNFANLSPSMNNSNAVVMPLSSAGAIDVFVNGGPQGAGLPVAHIRGVITGYYTAG